MQFQPMHKVTMHIISGQHNVGRSMHRCLAAMQQALTRVTTDLDGTTVVDDGTNSTVCLRFRVLSRSGLDLRVLRKISHLESSSDPLALGDDGDVAQDTFGLTFRKAGLGTPTVEKVSAIGATAGLGIQQGWEIVRVNGVGVAHDAALCLSLLADNLCVEVVFRTPPTGSTVWHPLPMVHTGTTSGARARDTPTHPTEIDPHVVLRHIRTKRAKQPLKWAVVKGRGTDRANGATRAKAPPIVVLRISPGGLADQAGIKVRAHPHSSLALCAVDAKAQYHCMCSSWCALGESACAIYSHV